MSTPSPSMEPAALKPALTEYYGQECFADLDIHIRAGDQLLKTVPGHRILLATQSEFFWTRMTRWATPAQTTPSPQGGQAPTPPSREQLVLMVERPEQLEVAEQLLQFFYDKSLPPSLSPQQLVDLVVLAHYHQAQDCQAACIQALTTITNHLMDFDSWWALLQLPDGLIGEAPVLQQLCAEADEFMFKQLLDLEVVLNEPLLRAWLLHLPGPYLLRLLSRRELQVAAESSVVAAISMWLEAQPQRGVSDQLLGQLARQVRLVGLPPSFMGYVLPHLAWFMQAVPPAALMQAFALLRVHDEGLISLAPFTTPSPQQDRANGSLRIATRLQELLPSINPSTTTEAWPGLLGQPRKASKVCSLTLEVDLDQQQLQQRWAQQGSGEWGVSTPVLWAGYQWQLAYRFAPLAEQWPTEGAGSGERRGVKRRDLSLSNSILSARIRPPPGVAAAGGPPQAGWEAVGPRTPGLTGAAGEQTTPAAAGGEGSDNSGSSSRWQMQVGVVACIPGVRDKHVTALVTKLSFTHEVALLPPGAKRPPYQVQRMFPDPTVGVAALKGNVVLQCPEVLPCWLKEGRWVQWGTPVQAEAHSRRTRQQLQDPEQQGAQEAATHGLSSGACRWQHMWEADPCAESEYSSLTLRVEVGQVR